MSFSLEAIRQLAKLSRLALREDEIVFLQSDLNQVIGYVEKLQQLDVSNIEPMTHAIPTEIFMRDDIPLEVVGRAGLIGSKAYEGGLLRVPKIIE